jgi:predicted SprT family Zn-dependent metalloprotease
MSLGRQLDFLIQLVPARRKAPAKPVTVEQPAAGRDTVMEARARDLLRGLDCAALVKRVKVRWNPRMRSTAGTALIAESLITLNPRLLDFGNREVDRTLRHELAHLLAHHRAGRRRIEPHGPEWERACRDLGLPDEKRCHTLPLPRRTMTPQHFYRCPACTQKVERVRPFRRKTACLDCCRRHNNGRYDERFCFLKLATTRKK